MGSHTAGVLAFLFALVWPSFFREARFMQTEPLFTLLVTATVAAFTRFALVPGARRAFLVGVCAGLASLVRPNGLVAAGGLLLGWLPHRLGGWKLELPRLAALALGTALVLAPWALRNAVLFHAFIPVSTGTGEYIYMGSTPETDGRWNACRLVLRGAGAQRDRAFRVLHELALFRAHPAAHADPRRRHAVARPVAAANARVEAAARPSRTACARGTRG